MWGEAERRSYLLQQGVRECCMELAEQCIAEVSWRTRHRMPKQFCGVKVDSALHAMLK